MFKLKIMLLFNTFIEMLLIYLLSKRSNLLKFKHLNLFIIYKCHSNIDLKNIYKNKRKYN